MQCLLRGGVGDGEGIPRMTRAIIGMVIFLFGIVLTFCLRKDKIHYRPIFLFIALAGAIIVVVGYSMK